VEALIFFGHFPGWKEQSTVQETLAAVVAEDRQAESQRWTDQHRCLVSFWCIKNFNFFFFNLPIQYPSPVAVTKQTIIR